MAANPNIYAHAEVRFVIKIVPFIMSAHSAGNKSPNKLSCKQFCRFNALKFISDKSPKAGLSSSPKAFAIEQESKRKYL